MKSWMIILIAIVLVGLIAGAGWLGFASQKEPTAELPVAPDTIPVTVCDVEQTISAPGNLVNANETYLSMPMTGRLGEFLVKAGDQVSEGQVLARLSEEDINKLERSAKAASLELLKAQQALSDLQAQSTIKSAQKSLDLALARKTLEEYAKKQINMNQPRNSDQLKVENAQTEYEFAKQAYKEATQEYNKFKHKNLTNPERAMALQNLVTARQVMERKLALYNWFLLKPSELDVERAASEVAVAQATLDQLLAEWQELQADADNLDVLVAEAEVENAQYLVDEAADALANVEIKAPFDGIVLAINVRAGEMVSEGMNVFLLNDPQAVEVQATVIEEDYPYVEAGKPADLFFDALPDESITGKVARIIPQRLGGDRPLYSIYLSLDRVPDKLVDGMSADASIVIASKNQVLCLPRALVKAGGNGSAVVEVWQNWQKVKRTVQVGLRGDTTVEILSGLKEGELVVAR